MGKDEEAKFEEELELADGDFDDDDELELDADAKDGGGLLQSTSKLGKKSKTQPHNAY